MNTKIQKKKISVDIIWAIFSGDTACDVRHTCILQNIICRAESLTSGSLF